GHPLDWIIAGRILSAAERRRASLLAVRLTCDEAQLRERISSEARRGRYKTTDAGQAGALAGLDPFPINHDWVFDLDTSGLTAAQTADRIAAELGSRLPS
ncbi:MAG: hypothetical protein ACREEO_11035, partial [Phenylobacterium sp.]